MPARAPAELHAWSRLLSADRLAGGSEPTPSPRSPFQRDYDRIIYSPAFRRLAGKTQVFPLPVDDHVHSRLTHSLEVATVGRSLGTKVGHALAARIGGLPEHLEPRDLGDCVAAACLAHDLGNPPFGHVGESAMQEYFRSDSGRAALATLSARERGDFEQFEGNAQGLRLALRAARPRATHGLNLTLATLGALVKYPCTSDARDAGAVPRKKHGVNQAELAAFTDVAQRLGLRPLAGTEFAWTRHPLAWLTEAADDIAYYLIDLEDGLRLGLVPFDEFMRLVAPLAPPHAVPTGSAVTRGREDRLEIAGRLRTLAIDTLIGECADVYMADLATILAGERTRSLIKEIPHAAAAARVKQADEAHCYNARDVLKMEIAGARAIAGLLDSLVDAVTGASKRSLRAEKLGRLYGDVLDAEGTYEQLLRVTDHVAGMTDHYVIRLYREFSGIRLPGGRD